MKNAGNNHDIPAPGKLEEYTCHYDSPLGSITMSSDGTALTGLRFDGQKHFAGTLASIHEGNPLPVFNEPLNANDTPNDRTGPTFYAGDTPKGATVTSLLMYGVGSSSSRADISNGRVFAVDRNGDTNLLRCGLSTLTRTPLSLQGD